MKKVLYLAMLLLSLCSCGKTIRIENRSFSLSDDPVFNAVMNGICDKFGDNYFVNSGFSSYYSDCDVIITMKKEGYPSSLKVTSQGNTIYRRKLVKDKHTDDLFTASFSFSNTKDSELCEMVYSGALIGRNLTNGFDLNYLSNGASLEDILGNGVFSTNRIGKLSVYANRKPDGKKYLWRIYNFEDPSLLKRTDYWDNDQIRREIAITEDSGLLASAGNYNINGNPGTIWELDLLKNNRWLILHNNGGVYLLAYSGFPVMVFHADWDNWNTGNVAIFSEGMSIRRDSYTTIQLGKYTVEDDQLSIRVIETHRSSYPNFYEMTIVNKNLKATARQLIELKGQFLEVRNAVFYDDSQDRERYFKEMPENVLSWLRYN